MAIGWAAGRVRETKAALAAPVGLSVSALQLVDFPWPNLDAPPSAASLSPGEIQRDAVLNRLALRRSLAQYAAAEAALQLETPNQYPDINIRPRYTFSEHHSLLTLALSTPPPTFNHTLTP